MTTLDFTGPRLTAALQEQPSLTLEFYSFGVLLRKREGDAVSEFAERLENVHVARNYKFMCSNPGQELIIEDIKQQELDRVVVKLTE